MAIETIYVGLRDAMIAEVSAWNPMQLDGMKSVDCKYLVYPDGDQQYDTEWCRTKQDAKAIAAEMARLHGAPVRWIY